MNLSIYHPFVPTYAEDGSIVCGYVVREFTPCGVPEKHELDHLWNCKCGMSGNGSDGHQCELKENQ